MTPVRLEPAALRSRVKHSTTEPLRSLNNDLFINHIRERWCNVIEDAKQYFLTCNQYRNERLIFFEAVRDFQTLNIKLLLGNDTPNNTSRAYIKNTKRFDTE